MIFALDTNVLLDVLYRDENFHEVSRETLEEKSEEGFFIISPGVYAELSSSFARRFEEDFRTELREFLDKKNIVVQKHSKDSLTKAGRAWTEYEVQSEVECPECGYKNSFECGECKSGLSWRNHIITDFMIGAHAEEKADALITRDRGYFRNYFDVHIIDPSS